MNLDDLQKLCDEATPGPWPLYYEVCPNEYGSGHPVLVHADCEFIAAARTWMPKLIEVAKAAQLVRRQLGTDAPEVVGPNALEYLCRSLDALEALEKP